jgi:hypothetical protein
MKLAVVTNILTPYRVSLFEAMAEQVDDFTVFLMARQGVFSRGYLFVLLCLAKRTRLRVRSHEGNNDFAIYSGIEPDRRGESRLVQPYRGQGHVES